MNILLLGGQTGLLGQALKNVLQADGHTLFFAGRHDPIFDNDFLKRTIQEKEISTIINTIAYTQVDKAEDEVKEATKINADLPELLGKIANETKTALVHYSTDFIFDGKKNKPYLPNDTPNPLNIYGKTKLEGEQRLMQIAPEKLLIIRTAWLFGPDKINFVHKILTLGKEKGKLTIVNDQIGSPTYTVDLARYSLALLQKQTWGIFHITNSGQASWYDLAVKAVQLTKIPCQIIPITSDNFPQKAIRPPFSVLNCRNFTTTTDITPRPWQNGLTEYLQHTVFIEKFTTPENLFK